MLFSVIWSAAAAFGATCDVGDGDVCVHEYVVGDDWGYVWCDTNTATGSGPTTLNVSHDFIADEYVFAGVDESGRDYECRYPDWSKVYNGIDPDEYYVYFDGTDQADQLRFSTYFFGARSLTEGGNDLLIGPPDASEAVFHTGDGNDWVSAWSDFDMHLDLGEGNDVALVSGSVTSWMGAEVMGEGGNDCIIGTLLGNDYVEGGDGNDSIQTKGNNCIGGGCATEEVDGGVGADTCAANGTTTNCEIIKGTTWNLVCPLYIP